MDLTAQIDIKGTKEAIWEVITDIDNSHKNISGIQKIEVLERPKEGVLGLKWRETRTMFGKEATEVMWITDLEDNVYYRTRAESHGAIYISSLRIKETDGGCILSMGFESEAITAMAKIGNVIFSGMMKKSMVKGLYDDLVDIKKVVESK